MASFFTVPTGPGKKAMVNFDLVKTITPVGDNGAQVVFVDGEGFGLGVSMSELQEMMKNPSLPRQFSQLPP